MQENSSTENGAIEMIDEAEEIVICELTEFIGTSFVDSVRGASFYSTSPDEGVLEIPASSLLSSESSKEWKFAGKRKPLPGTLVLVDERNGLHSVVGMASDCYELSLLDKKQCTTKNIKEYL